MADLGGRQPGRSIERRTVRLVTTFATARLQARPVTVDDVPLFARLWGDERVGRILGGVRDRAEVQQSLVEASAHWRR